MKTFSNEVRQFALQLSGYCCEECGRHISRVGLIDAHHGVRNDKENREKYGVLLHSIINCYMLCRIHCHPQLKHKHRGFRTDRIKWLSRFGINPKDYEEFIYGENRKDGNDESYDSNISDIGKVFKVSV